MAAWWLGGLQGHSLWVVAPVLSGNWSYLGEPDKIVKVQQRASLHCLSLLCRRVTSEAFLSQAFLSPRQVRGGSSPSARMGTGAFPWDPKPTYQLGFFGVNWCADFERPRGAQAHGRTGPGATGGR